VVEETREGVGQKERGKGGVKEEKDIQRAEKEEGAQQFG